VDDPKSGVINDQWEHRYGEYVKGAYSLLGPDGKLRIVDYEVDGHKGFHAVVRTQYPSKLC
jgi:Insect cuticle protein.